MSKSEKPVGDPHPATEEHYDQIPHPGGANPPKERDRGVEVYRHTGVPERPPRNVENDR